MRPLKLEIQAMGPYKNREIIDFTTLGEKRFFLIHGPTGSGKTSILDAMTYALYGDTSGEERSIEQMRSQWADGDTESYVLFEFYIRDKLYRIKRSPRQTLNKKRGPGTREVNPEAALWLAGDNDDLIETGASRVTERIEALLGFSSGQFRQVIVLPQGKFRELLAAKAEGREEILKVLFSTERFTQIQIMIRERANDVKKRLDSLYLERDAVLRGEEAESADELIARGSALKAEAADFRKVMKKLEAEEKKLQGEMKAAAVIEARFAERDMAAEALKSLQEREDEIRNYAETIESGRKALSLADIYKSLSDERILHSEIELNLAESRDEFTAAVKRRSETEIRVKDIPVKKDELKFAEQELYKLESCRNIYTEIAKADEEIKLNEKIKTDAEKRSLAQAEKKRELETLMQRIRCQVNEAEVAAAKLSALNLSLERITAAGKKIADIEKAEADVAKLVKDIPALEKKHETAIKKYSSLCCKRGEAEELWRKGQASLLASELKSGEPCPVCGSVHHPIPAATDKKTPAIDEIEKLKSDEKTADDEVRSFEVEIVKKRAELESIKAQMPASDDIPEEYRGLTRDDLKRIFRDESEELKRVSGISAALDSLRDKFADTEKKLFEVTAEGESAASEVKDAEVSLAALRSRRNQLHTGLPVGIDNLEKLIAETGELKKRIKDITFFITNCENACRDASERYTAAETLYRKMDGDSKTSKERLNSKELEFSNRLGKEGFKSESDFTVMIQNADNLKELEAVVEKFNKEQIAVKGRLERAHAEIGKAERPDIASISEKIEFIRNETEQAIGMMKRAESDGARLEKIAERIRLIEQSAAAEDQEFGVIQKLADVAGGKNSRKLTFQRYVLQSLFEEVLMIASNRLERMSRGRYRLISPGKIEDRRTSGGLDLEVFDEYTGYSRPVVTLSGGEAFLASLSLALGLADLVQQYAGGIHLDTVFIDEGFGSLDSETLDLAINTLIDLQSSGRLVGIISHVNELKERIDARLEVIPVACGSTTRFVV